MWKAAPACRANPTSAHLRAGGQSWAWRRGSDMRAGTGTGYILTPLAEHCGSGDSTGGPARGPAAAGLQAGGGGAASGGGPHAPRAAGTEAEAKSRWEEAASGAWTDQGAGKQAGRVRPGPPSAAAASRTTCRSSMPAPTCHPLPVQRAVLFEIGCGELRNVRISNLLFALFCDCVVDQSAALFLA